MPSRFGKSHFTYYLRVTTCKLRLMIQKVVFAFKRSRTQTTESVKILPIKYADQN